MAFFLKKTKLKNRTYLAIYESFYNHDKKGTAHKCYKSLASVETSRAKSKEGIQKISDTKGESRYINTTTYSDLINDLSGILNLPLTNYFLTET